MRNNIVVDILPEKYLDNLLKHCPVSTYQTETEIIYEGHMPNAGYLLIEGEINFLKRKRIIHTIGPGTLFGVCELMDKSKIQYTVKISKNSKVCILDKSTVKELLEKLSEDELPHIFKSLVA